jgi:putative ABC transport system ATP-binding protein
MNIVEVIDVKKTYGMGDWAVHALKGVSISIKKSSWTMIMGHSGSGKSTLLQIMGCLDKPTSGKVIIDGINSSKMNDSELAHLRNQKIGFVFQSFNLLSKLTALENVEMPMIYAGVASKVRKERAMELLKIVGLEDRATHKPNQLSGGQQQRVAIARALANDPQIILADEPTGNLDTTNGEEILKVLDELHKKGKTIITVTHDPDIVKYGEIIITITDGLVNDVKENQVALWKH